MAEPLKVLIVDDSITYRAILNNVLSTISDVTVVSTASNGKSALLKLSQNSVDIVLLDIEMPEMDGLETLRAISALYKNIGVVMVSGMNRHSADITIKALEAGALDFIPKPDFASMEANVEALKSRLLPIFRTFALKHGSHVSTVEPAPLRVKPVSSISAPSSRTTSVIKQVDVLVIGVSTGGPNALNELIPKLPGNIGIPVFIVQHMPPIFTESLANSLDRKSALQVKEAEHGETIQADTVYIAPGGSHMKVRSITGYPRQIQITDDAPENSCRPAVDVLFRSVADSYERNILAVIMTGMGSDGAQGVRYIKNKPNNYCITQDADSCVVYGMPKAVDELELSDESLPLYRLSQRISTLVTS